MFSNVTASCSIAFLRRFASAISSSISAIVSYIPSRCKFILRNFLSRNFVSKDRVSIFFSNLVLFSSISLSLFSKFLISLSDIVFLADTADFVLNSLMQNIFRLRLPLPPLLQAIRLRSFLSLLYNHRTFHYRLVFTANVVAYFFICTIFFHPAMPIRIHRIAAHGTLQ